MVLTRLKEVNIKLNPNKCVFVVKHISFLGHVINQKGIMFDPLKIKAVLEFHVPMLITNVRAFLGLIGYYWNYIKGYAKIVTWACLAQKKKDVDFKWVPICQGAFETSKQVLVETTILY